MADPWVLDADGIDRMIAAERDARAEDAYRRGQVAALREAADTFEWAGDDEDYAAFMRWLRDRADRIARGGDDRG